MQSEVKSGDKVCCSLCHKSSQPAVNRMLRSAGAVPADDFVSDQQLAAAVARVQSLAHAVHEETASYWHSVCFSSHPLRFATLCSFAAKPTRTLESTHGTLFTRVLKKLKLGCSSLQIFVRAQSLRVRAQLWLHHAAIARAESEQRRRRSRRSRCSSRRGGRGGEQGQWQRASIAKRGRIVDRERRAEHLGRAGHRIDAKTDFVNRACSALERPASALQFASLVVPWPVPCTCSFSFQSCFPRASCWRMWICSLTNSSMDSSRKPCRIASRTARVRDRHAKVHARKETTTSETSHNSEFQQHVIRRDETVIRPAFRLVEVALQIKQGDRKSTRLNSSHT